MQPTKRHWSQYSHRYALSIRSELALEKLKLKHLPLWRSFSESKFTKSLHILSTRPVGVQIGKQLVGLRTRLKRRKKNKQTYLKIEKEISRSGKKQQNNKWEQTPAEINSNFPQIHNKSERNCNIKRLPQIGLLALNCPQTLTSAYCSILFFSAREQFMMKSGIGFPFPNLDVHRNIQLNSFFFKGSIASI